MKAKIIYFILLVVTSIRPNAQQVPNSGFENWTNLAPDGWKTNSCPMCDSPYDRYIVKRDSDACQGTYSAKFIYNKVSIAWAEAKIITSVHPSDLFACVKSNIQTGDSVRIDITMYFMGDTSDVGQWISKSTISTYQNISIPISQKTPSVDSIKIKITGGGQVNTTLYADELSFTPVNSIHDNLLNDTWTLTPNSFDDFTILEFSNPDYRKFILKIYSPTGQIVQTVYNIYTGKVRIARGNLSSGIYYFVLSGHSKIFASGKFIIK
jgi:hypothetical protein